MLSLLSDEQIEYIIAFSVWSDYSNDTVLFSAGMVYGECVSCNGVVLYEFDFSVCGFQELAIAGFVSDCVVYIFGIEPYGSAIFR